MPSIKKMLQASTELFLVELYSWHGHTRERGTRRWWWQEARCSEPDSCAYLREETLSRSRFVTHALATGHKAGLALLSLISAMDYRVHTSYAPGNPPEHPGKPWTRFVCISDTHSRTSFAVPPGDILIHAGDLSSWGKLSQLRPTLDWLRSLPHEIKL